MEIFDDNYLLHRYWGKSIPSYHFSNRPILKKRTFAATPKIESPEISPEFLPFEMPFSHMGDYRNSAVQCQLFNGETITRFKYHSFEISEGAKEISELPHARDNEQFSETLTINLVDDISKIKLSLFYTIFEDSAVIVRSSKITNIGKTSIDITKLLSASIDLRYENQNCTTFYGTHQKEYQLNRSEIQHGLFKIGSSRGASGPQYPPYLALSNNASEFSGEVHAMSLIYSGNHEINLERDQYNSLRLQIGINSETFSWTLNSNESFYTPQAVLSYSDKGFNGSSSQFHQFFTQHLVHPKWKNKKRPILINSWEMTYFDVNEKLMKELIDSASDLGFETVVLDDGWYGKRNNSKTSLGDWKVDKEKFPNGIRPLVEYAHKKSIGFGIWFEPEMISPNTDLIKKHPDWVMGSQRYQSLLGRSQYVLDLTNSEVQKFILNTVSTTITELGIDYVKWDMNRHISEPFSQNNPNNAQEYSHRYMLSLYKIIDELTERHSHVLFENCSSGGGRLDPGMLYYFPQTWVSDNTDGLDRQQIQYGASYLFPISSMTGHVSEAPNHQTGRMMPFDTRVSLASSTNMGYEMDIIHQSEKTREQIKNHLRNYKEERDLVMGGKFYRLESPFETNLCAWMFVDSRKENAIIRVIRNRFNVYDLSILIRIPYLDQNSLYMDTSSRQVYSGAELLHCGLSLKNTEEDLQTTEIKLIKIKKESE